MQESTTECCTPLTQTFSSGKLGLYFVLRSWMGVRTAHAMHGPPRIPDSLGSPEPEGFSLHVTHLNISSRPPPRRHRSHQLRWPAHQTRPGAGVCSLRRHGTDGSDGVTGGVADACTYTTLNTALNTEGYSHPLLREMWLYAAGSLSPYYAAIPLPHHPPTFWELADQANGCRGGHVILDE